MQRAGQPLCPRAPGVLATASPQGAGGANMSHPPVSPCPWSPCPCVTQPLCGPAWQAPVLSVVNGAARHLISESRWAMSPQQGPFQSCKTRRIPRKVSKEIRLQGWAPRAVTHPPTPAQARTWGGGTQRQEFRCPGSTQPHPCSELMSPSLSPVQPVQTWTRAQGPPCSERDRSCFCSSAPCPHSH